MYKLLTLTSAAGALSLAALSLLPLIRSDQWWIRVWDFPRLQILVIALAIGGALFLARMLRSHWSGVNLLTALVIVVVVAIQASKIVPFSPLWPVEVMSAEAAGEERCLSIVISNVRMQNRQSRVLIDLLGRLNADVVLVLENDQWWSEELAQFTQQYPHVLNHPRDNTYGLLFMSRLPVSDLQLRFITDPEIGSIKVGLELRSGDWVNFYGVHPKPPRIGQDTDLRDHELISIAHEIKAQRIPAIVSGDLNDVAWSKTTQLFKRTGKLRDPRIGRGLYSTYHADQPLMRWPLDHAFHTDHFRLKRLSRLEFFGSDHFPLLTELCLTAQS